MIALKKYSSNVILFFALVTFSGRHNCDANYVDDSALVTDHSSLRAAIANGSIANINVVANIEFPAKGFELLIPENRTVKISSSNSVVFTGGGITRFFNVAGDLTIQGLTLKNGRSKDGGAVFVSSTGALTVLHCTFSYNRALVKQFTSKPRRKDEDTIKLIWGEGGAIRSEGRLLFVEHSTFMNNAGVGGAIWSGESDSPTTESRLITTDTIFDSNKSPDSFAGAVANFAKASFLRCTFMKNSAETSAGAVFSANAAKPIVDALLELHGSAFSENKAEYGDLSNDITIRGGGAAGDLSCGDCEVFRNDGGLTNGFCSALKCTGCPTNMDGNHESAYYQCSMGKGSKGSTLRQIAGKIQTVFW